MKPCTLTLGIALTLTGLASAAPGVRAQQAGTISGTVVMEAGPARRQAVRYRNRAQTVQTPAAVVFLKGRIEGPAPPGFDAHPEMVQRDTAFAPATVVVMTGGTVSFPNQDPFFHNVFSMSGTRRFDLGRYPEGESKDVAFDKAGTVEVFCEVHDFMRGAIVVTENPYHTTVEDDGTFTMVGVPAGTHTVVAWHPDHGSVEQQVTVTSGGVVRIEVELR